MSTASNAVPILLFMVLGLLLALAAAKAFFQIRRARRRREAAEAPVETSIFQILRRQVQERPDGPIDEDKLPHQKLDGGQFSFAAGMIDALAGRLCAGGDDPAKPAKELEQVRKAILDVNAGTLMDWRRLEAAIKGVRALPYVDSLLGGLTPSDVTPNVRRLFWDVARRSRDIEAIKWGLAVGSIGLSGREAEDLLLLARYAEFTLFAAVALQRESERDPAFKRLLVKLLPLCHQWGVIRLVDVIVRDKDLVSDLEVQREILVHGMRNCEGIPMEVAFTIAGHVDLDFFLKAAVKDDRIHDAVTSLMISLMDEPQPLGGLKDLEDGREALDACLELLRRRKPDVRALSLLHSAEAFLSDGELPWPDRAARLDEVRSLAGELFSEEIVRAGLAVKETHWEALQLVRSRKLTGLLGDVADLLRKEPGEMGAILALAELGNDEHLRFLLETIPRLVDPEERAKRETSRQNVFGPENRNGFEYAEIVKALARLDTPEALAALKRAARDYAPTVRAAACQAFARMDPSRIDDEVRGLIRERLGDAPEYVPRAAVEAARRAGLPVPENLEKPGPPRALDE